MTFRERWRRERIRQREELKLWIMDGIEMSVSLSLLGISFLMVMVLCG